jgi:KUP system potassium uptake protein
MPDRAPPPPPAEGDLHALRPALVLVALGIVFGDIGTSPLYALRECFGGEQPLAISTGNVLGVLSLVFWSLIVVISFKYVFLLLRADNHGEGGLLALVSLLTYTRGARRRGHEAIVLLGIAGAALLYADTAITPALTVLSAIEGIEVYMPELATAVVPATLLVLFGLFAIQSRGTAWVGALFGPVMLAWFVTIGGIGLASLVQTPEVLAALHPAHALRFFAANGYLAFAVLGMVFLVVTGGEALYADMGHVGRGSVRAAWFAIVLPALLLSYFGQGAHLLRTHDLDNLFFRIAPAWSVIPLVLLATLASAVASQAVISGAFTLTQQATQLGYCPRVDFRQTSAHAIGQIYVPFVNWVLFAAASGLVLAFGSSSGLTGAYGISVAGSMLITAVLLLPLLASHWRTDLLLATAVALPLVLIHAAFLAATMLRLESGGWLPLVAAIAIFLLFGTWRTGRRFLERVVNDDAVPAAACIESVATEGLARVPGTAVYLTRSHAGVPRTLLHNIKHNHVLHENVVFVTVETERIPRVAASERIAIESLGSGFHRLRVRFGFAERSDLASTLAKADLPIRLDPMQTSYFLGHESIVVAERRRLRLPRWQRMLFAALHRNALDASRYFGIPPNRAVQIGEPIEV